MLIDGTPGNALPASDRGLHYGDGLFETIAVFGGRPLLLDRHLARLQSGCRRLGIPPPENAVLAEETGRLCRDAARGVIKIIVTRGTGGRGYQPPEPARPARILSLHDWPAYPVTARRGIDAPICGIRLARQPALAGLKHLNRLEQVLGRSALSASGALEGIMLDTEGLAIGGTMSNLFAIQGEELWTPNLSASGVEGVVRAEVLARAADWSLRQVIRSCTPEDIASADEAFLTNSLIGVWPLKSIGGQPLRSTSRTAAIARALEDHGAIAPA